MGRGPSGTGVRMSDGPEGFAEFVAARQRALLRSAMLLTTDRALAEDLLQVGLLKTWARWGRLDRAGSPEAYVRKVMYSTYVDLWRRGLLAARVRGHDGA